MKTKEQLFHYIEGYVDGFDDLPDGAYWALHQEAVESWNGQSDTPKYDWFDIMAEYVEWYNKEHE